LQVPQGADGKPACVVTIRISSGSDKKGRRRTLFWSTTTIDLGRSSAATDIRTCLTQAFPVGAAPQKD
jgi:hypothetical protein